MDKHMILWNDKKLARKLRNNAISEKEKFKYYFIYVLLYMLPPIYCKPLERAPGVLVELLFFTLIYLIGLYYTYSTNCKGDNKAFIERSLCLSIPIAVRRFVLELLFVIIGVAVLPDNPRSNETAVFTTFVNFVDLIFYYYRLNKCIKIASSLPDQDNNIKVGAE